MSVTIFAGKSKNSLLVTNENAAARRAQEKETCGKKSTIYAGEIAVRPDSIAIKKKQAQKQAMKVLGDVFQSEKKIDQSMDEMAGKIQELRDENLGYHKELSQIVSMREQRMETYGISAESTEHQDLELLRKERDMGKPGDDVTLTQEERQCLSEIHETGITDYQRDMLELDDRQKFYQENILKNENQIKEISSALTDTKIERLKTHPMVDAGKEAEKIMEAANKEIYGELVNEGRKHIEEKMEEEKEKVEERAEKKEEEEEKKAKREEREALQDEVIEKAGERSDFQIEVKKPKKPKEADSGDVEQITAYNSAKPKLDKELEEILKELKLMKEDLKGAALDKNI